MKSALLVHELVHHLVPWMRLVLAFVDRALPHMRLFYAMMGVEENWLDLFVDLELCMSGSRLCVAAKHRNRDDLLNMLHSVMLKR